MSRECNSVPCNTLATCGTDGTLLQNVQSGSVHHAPTVTTINSLTWSSDRTEFINEFEASRFGIQLCQFGLCQDLKVGTIGSTSSGSGRCCGADLWMEFRTKRLIEPGTVEVLIC